MDSGSLRVLLVEDDETLAEMYLFKLVAEGYDVRVASDRPSGLAAALQRPPDLLLLYLRLPGLGGLDLLEHLCRSPGGANLPVFDLLGAYGHVRNWLARHIPAAPDRAGYERSRVWRSCRIQEPRQPYEADPLPLE